MTTPNLNRLLTRQFLRYIPPVAVTVPEVPEVPATPVVQPGPADVEHHYTKRVDDSTPGDTRGEYFVPADGDRIHLANTDADGELLPAIGIGDQIRLRWATGDVAVYAIDVTVLARTRTSDVIFNPPTATATIQLTFQPDLDLASVPALGGADLYVGILGTPALPPAAGEEVRYNRRILDLRANQSNPGEYFVGNFNARLSRLSADNALLGAVVDGDEVRFRWEGYTVTVTITLAQALGTDALQLFFPETVNQSLLPIAFTTEDVYVSVITTPVPEPGDPTPTDTGRYELVEETVWANLFEQGVSSGILSIGVGSAESIQITLEATVRAIGGKFWNPGDTFEDDLGRSWTVSDARFIRERRYIEVRAYSGIYIP